MRYYILFFAFFAFLLHSKAQINTYYIYGGDGNEAINNFIKTPDGGFLAVGYIQALGQVHGTSGFKNGLVVKFSADGVIQWAKSYGGVNNDEFLDVAYYQGYYYCVGTTSSWSTQTTSTLSTVSDVLLLKIDMQGNVQWANNYGEPSVVARINDACPSIIATNNSGVLMVGSSGVGNSIDQNIITFRVLPDGSTGFAKSYDLPASIIQPTQTAEFGGWPVKVDNNQYVLAGNIYGGSNNRAPILLRINNLGGIEWSRRIEPSAGNQGIETTVFDAVNGRIITGGVTPNATDYDAMLFKDIKSIDGTSTTTTPTGKLISATTTDFRKCNLYPKEDPVTGVFNGYYLTLTAAGTLDSVKINAMDAEIFSLDASFGIVWRKKFGGQRVDYAKNAMTGCTSNDVITMGGTRSASGVLSTDLLFGKLKSDGTFNQNNVTGCISNSAFALTDKSYTNTALTGFVTSDLPPTWKNTITNMPAPLNVQPYLLLKTPCDNGALPSTEFRSANIQVETITQSEKKIRCTFNNQTLLNFNFKVEDMLGFVYFSTDKPNILNTGVKLKKLDNIPAAGIYSWKYEAMLENGTVDIQTGMITIQ